MADDSNKAARYNGGKLRLDLLPVDAIRAFAEVMSYGAQKYAEYNWAKGDKWSVPLASLERHLLLWKGGEDRDSESGLPHMAHIICNAAFLIVYAVRGLGKDDRYLYPKPEEAPAAPAKPEPSKEHTPEIRMCPTRGCLDRAITGSAWCRYCTEFLKANPGDDLPLNSRSNLK